MADAPVDHGSSNRLLVDPRFAGSMNSTDNTTNTAAIVIGTAALTAGATTTITDSAISSGGRIFISALTSGAGRTLSNLSWWTTTPADGSFTITFSATAAGYPSATDVIQYVLFKHT